MPKVIVVQSRYLLSRESSGDLLSYKYSEHRKGLTAVAQALDVLEIVGERWDESDLETVELSAFGNAKVFVVPGMRVCTEKAFQKLLRLAQEGCIVFSWVDSFYYDRVQDSQPTRVISRRIKEVFQLPEDASVESRFTINGQISIDRSRYSWLTEGVPTRQAWNRRYVLTVVGGSDVMHYHGNVTAEEFRSDAQIDESLKGHVLPAFLIREFASGGMFIYGCYGANLSGNFKQLIRNLVNRSSMGAAEVSSDLVRGLRVKLRVSRIMNIVLGALFFLLLAKVVVGDSWTAYLGGALSGAVVGYLSNKLTDWLNRYAS